MSAAWGRALYWPWVVWCFWDGWDVLTAGPIMLLIYLLGFAEIVAWNHDRERHEWIDIQRRLTALRIQVDQALGELRPPSRVGYQAPQHETKH